MRLLIGALAVLSVVTPAAAAGRAVTLFLDGARMEESVRAAKGHVDVLLPAGTQPGSLRIKPLGKTVIERVDVVASPRPETEGKERSRLEERRERLHARLKALETREEIFRAAAKSQSGKTPRKTKTNPDPLDPIRRGTDFAMGQLEEVYRQRQQAEKELREVEKRLATRKEEGGQPSRARIWMTKGGSADVSYVLPRLYWRPRYDFRLKEQGIAEIVQRSVVPPVEKGTEIFLASSRLATPDAVTQRRPAREAVSSYSVTVEREDFAAAIPSSVAFTFKNTSETDLPPGEASCFRRGEYLGTFSFPGARKGETREVVCGR